MSAIKFSLVLALTTVAEAARVQANALSKASVNASLDWPACPCTIFPHFCTRHQVSNGGAVCVSIVDGIVTSVEQVQCVPRKNGGLIGYKCPGLVPMKCDPEQTPEGCDLSGIAQCSIKDCGWDWFLKPPGFRPWFCRMHECLRTECCSRCPEMEEGVSEQDGSTCVHSETREKVDQWCCKRLRMTKPDDVIAKEKREQEREQELEDMEKTEVDVMLEPTPLTCPERVTALSNPTIDRYERYKRDCKFKVLHINFDKTNFALNDEGRENICDPRCKQAFKRPPPQNTLKIAKKVATQCEDRTLSSQLGSSGVFAATDALDAIWSGCHVKKECKDIEGWVDAGGATCAEYEEHSWCSHHYEEGGPRYGATPWLHSYVTKDGHTADTACCICNGGETISKMADNDFA